MKSYDFSPDEFAKLALLLTSMVAFHHQQRSQRDLDDFSTRIYPLLKQVTYAILGDKISDEQREKISRDDPWDMSQDDALRILRKVFSS